jgi:hypothetical protein
MSRYKAIKNRNIIKRNLGFNWRDRILLLTTDNSIYNNSNIIDFAIYIEKIINHWIDSVKSIKRAKNPFLEKDDLEFN